MKDPVMWVLAIAAIGVLIAVFAALGRSGGQRGSADVARAAAVLLARLTSAPGVQVVDHCVSGDAAMAIGIDKLSRSLVLAYRGEGQPVLQFRPGTLRTVEIVEDHETVAKTARGGVNRWRSPNPRVFSSVRSLGLRIEIEGEQRAHVFNLIWRDRGIDRADPVYQYAVQTGERWFELISSLIHAEAAQSTLRLQGMHASKEDVARQLQRYLQDEQGEAEPVPAEAEAE